MLGWIQYMRKYQNVVFFCLFAACFTAILAIIAATFGVSSVEWADTASRWSVLITAVTSFLLALIQIVLSSTGFTKYEPKAIGEVTTMTDDVHRVDKNFNFKSSRKFEVDGIYYYSRAYIVREEGDPIPTELTLRHGKLTAEGLQPKDNVYYSKVNFPSTMCIISEDLIIL